MSSVSHHTKVSFVYGTTWHMIGHHFLPGRFSVRLSRHRCTIAQCLASCHCTRGKNPNLAHSPRLAGGTTTHLASPQAPDMPLLFPLASLCRLHPGFHACLCRDIMKWLVKAVNVSSLLRVWSDRAHHFYTKLSWCWFWAVGNNKKHKPRHIFEISSVLKATCLFWNTFTTLILLVLWLWQRKNADRRTDSRRECAPRHAARSPNENRDPGERIQPLQWRVIERSGAGCDQA